MIELPTPKRYVVGELYTPWDDPCFVLDADADVFDFVRLLAPVGEVRIWPAHEAKGRAWIQLNPRYAYDTEVAKQCYAWIMEQLALEFGGTPLPLRAQHE